MRLTRRDLLKFGGMALTIAPSLSWADNDNTFGMPPFDFADAFYRENGINPLNILNRVNGTCPGNDMPACSVVDNTNTDPDRRNIRVLSTTGGFNHEDNPLYYNIFGMMMPNTFTNDAAGKHAMGIANFFSAYIFPKASGDPLSPALSNRRQDNVFDTRNGYFEVNPLGVRGDAFNGDSQTFGEQYSVAEQEKSDENA